MNVVDALLGVRRLFLDTAPVIYFVERNPVYFDRVAALFAQIETSDITAVTSPITLAECLVTPISRGLTRIQADFEDLITAGDNTEFVPIDSHIAVLAANLRATYRLRLMDAIQVATAIRSGCGAITTNDADLKRVSEVRVLVIDDLRA